MIVAKDVTIGALFVDRVNDALGVMAMNAYGLKHALKEHMF